MQWWKHAFAIESTSAAETTPAEDAVIDRLVQFVIRRGMATPALLFLDCCHPLNFIASQVLVFFGPFASVIFNRQEYRAFVKFLEQRGSVEILCRRIEEALAAQAAGSGESDLGDPRPDPQLSTSAPEDRR